MINANYLRVPAAAWNIEAALWRAQNAELAMDAGRLDWLADPDNEIGNVQLPTQCVLDNPHSMRDAIDAAMKEQAK